MFSHCVLPVLGGNWTFMFYCFMMGDLDFSVTYGLIGNHSPKTIVTIYLESMVGSKHFLNTLSHLILTIYGFINSVISALAVEEVK